MRVLFILLLSVLCCSISFGQQYKWVHGGGSLASISSPDLIEGTYFSCTDYNGNVYCLSEVGNTGIVVDTFHHNAYGHNQNAMFTSYNCQGQLRFAKLIACSDGAYVQGLKADTTGHIYLAVDLPHGLGSYTVHLGYDTAFTGLSNQRESIIQYDTSGHFNWIKFVGTNIPVTYNMGGRWGHLTIDGENNPHFICGMYAGVIISPTVTSTKGFYDLKYSSSGVLLSAKRLHMDTTMVLKSISIDKPSGKLYTIGYTPTPTYSLNFIAGFDTVRSMMWYDTLTCPGHPGGAGASAIIADNIGHLYFCGNATQTIVYHNDTFTNALSTIGYSVSFVIKIDTGNHLKWLRGFSITGSTINYYNGITMMPGNRIAATGLMGGMLVGGMDTITSYSGEGQNAFFSILDSGGYVHTIQQIHGSGFYDAGCSVTADKTGSLFVSGYIASNAWADTLTHYNSVGGNSDFFTLKYGVDCSCSSIPFASYASSGSPTVSFNYNGTVTGIDSIHWRFGDGGISNSMTPTHTYAAVGHYTACVEVFSSCGNDEVCHDVYIPCIVAPTAAFTSSGISATRNFTYTGTTGLDSVVWNYGDGGHGTGNTSSHTYTTTGVFNVCVTAYSQCGSHTSCSTITITCVTAPIVSFTNTGAPATSFTYTGTTTGLDSVSWRYGDGAQGSGLTSIHSYTLGGTYIACAIAYNHCGWDSACAAIVVPCPPPVAAITNTNDTFHYTGTTPTIDSIVWDFGDGFTDTGMSPVHPYAVTDTYHVCVRVYGYCGADTLCSDFIVTGVGINMVSLADVSVYPNPVTDMLFVAGAEGALHYRLLSVAGVVLADAALPDGHYKLSLAGYIPGVYLLELIHPDGRRQIFRLLKL